ncbi:MAG TPA: CHRD domain-containing protein [Acidimicrobiia bacterium]|nr:CHRD domain-containing protein [Acidimicrobiia bacterium]
MQDPAVVSDGEGEAELVVRSDGVRYKVKWEDLTSPVVAGHIHCAPAGSNGAVGVTLVHEPLDADDRVRGTFTGPDASNQCGWADLEDVLSAIIDGNAYINIHTENFRSGEIRGQVEIEDLEFEDRLDPGQEVQDPAVVSDGEGESEFTWRRGRVRYAVEWEDLTSPVGAGHIHCAPAGSNGSVGVTLVHEPLDADDRVRGSFTEPDAGNACMWDSLGDVLAAMLTGNAYVNIHTANFQAGEIRGQID